MSASERRPFVVLGFASTHAALDAEAALEADGLDCTPVPSPESLGGLCGIGLRLEPASERAALACLARAHIDVSARVETWEL